MAVILDFWSEWYELLLIFKLPWYFLLSFKSIGLLFQKKSRIDFQDGGHLGFLIRVIFAISDLQVTLILFTKSFWFRRQRADKGQNRFSNWLPWHPTRFPITTILTVFDLQVTMLLPTKFQVDWTFGSREAKNRFLRWPPRQPYWISDRNNFTYFLSTCLNIS